MLRRFARTLWLLPLVFVVPARPVRAASVAVGCSAGALATAIRTANANPGADTLILSGGCDYQFSSPATDADLGFWYGPTALPLITSEITIQGGGATIRRLPTAPPFRLFAVAGADVVEAGTPTAGSLTLVDVTLAGGFARGGDGASGGGGGAGLGGAIFSQGALSLDGVTIRDSEARGGDGTAGLGGGGGGVAGFGGLPSADGGGGGGGGMGGNGASATGLGGAGGGGFGGSGAANGDAGGGGGGATGPANGSAGGGHSPLPAPWSDGGDGGAAMNDDGDDAPGPGGAGGGGAENGDGGDGAFGGGGGGGGAGSNQGGEGGTGGGGGGNASGGAGGLGRFGGGGGSGAGGGGAGGYGAGGGAPNGAPGTFAGDGTPGGGGGGSGLGGAIFIDRGSFSAVNSTLSGNRASRGVSPISAGQGLGGGLFVANGTALLSSVTMANNQAPEGGAALFIDGGAVMSKNTILADSKNSVTDCEDTGGGLLSLGHNLTEKPGTCSFSQVTDIKGQDPLLLPLADNGGPTFTHEVPVISPAFEAGDCAVTVDQRDVERRQLPVCEIGAYEVDRFFLTILINGEGEVVGTFDCQETCTQGPMVTRTIDESAIAGAGWMFGSWDGPCVNNDPFCEFQLTQDTTLVVNFVPIVQPPADAGVPQADAALPQPDAALPDAGGADSGGQPDGGVQPADAAPPIDAPPPPPPDAAPPIDAPPPPPPDAAAPVDAAPPVDAVVVAADAAAPDAVPADARPNDAAVADAAPPGPDAGRLLPLDHGCGCRVADPTREAPGTLLLVGLTLVLARVTRRRKRA